MPVDGWDAGCVYTRIWSVVLCVCVHDVCGVSMWMLSPWLPGQVRKRILPPEAHSSPSPKGYPEERVAPLCVFAYVRKCV